MEGWLRTDRVHGARMMEEASWYALPTIRAVSLTLLSVVVFLIIDLKRKKKCSSPVIPYPIS